MIKEWIDKPDLLERLADLHNFGLTDTERCEMRMEAFDEILKLRERVEALEQLNSFRVHQNNTRPR
jgi:hypothetical protein